MHTTLWIKGNGIKRPLNLVILILGGRLKTLQKHEGTSSSGLATISHSLQHPPTVGIPTKEKINKRCCSAGKPTQISLVNIIQLEIEHYPP